MKERRKTRDRRRRAYAKPAWRPIELAAEEVLGIGCKSDSGGQASLSFTCTGNGCASIGS